MSFCNSATKAIRHLMDQITPELGVVIDDVTKVTGQLKALEANPAVDAIVKAIPGGTAVEAWLNLAIDEIVPAVDSVKTLAEKLSEWLATSTSEYDSNAKLFKLASVSAKIADVLEGNPAKSEKVYDSGVLLRVIANDHA